MGHFFCIILYNKRILKNLILASSLICQRHLSCWPWQSSITLSQRPKETVSLIIKTVIVIQNDINDNFSRFKLLNKHTWRLFDCLHLRANFKHAPQLTCFYVVSIFAFGDWKFAIYIEIQWTRHFISILMLSFLRNTSRSYYYHYIFNQWLGWTCSDRHRVGLMVPTRAFLGTLVGVCVQTNLVLSRALEAVDLRAASASTLPLPLPLPPKSSFFTSCYPSNLFGSGCYSQPLPLPKSWS